MGTEFVQTKIKKEVYQYLRKRIGTNNVYQMTQTAVLGYYKLLRTMEKVNYTLGTDFDDPDEFLAVVKTLLRHPQLSKVLLESIQEGI